jgi:predicted MFS family arabinose efflux permease
MTRSGRYESTLIGLMFLTFGTIFLDRMTQFYLAPYLIPDLHVNNIQIGMMASALALAVRVFSVPITNSAPHPLPMSRLCK